MKVSKGKIIDVLIRVREFIYPINFVVLQTQPLSNPRSQTLVILGRLFLTTANTVINCRNESMRLIFGDITREVNVSKLEKQPHNVENQTFEVNLIENMTSEHREETELEAECEFELEFKDFNLNQLSNLL